MTYSLIAFDLDFTLLDLDTSLSPQNQTALLQLRQKGVHVVPNSGRTLMEMPQFIRENPAFRYLIYSDGAVVYDRLTNERNCECLSHELSMQVLHLLNEYETLITARNNGISYTDARFYNEEGCIYHQMRKGYRDFLFETNVPKENFMDFCQELDEIEMICVFFHSDSDLEECRSRLLKMGSLKCASSAPHNLEIFSVRAGKGEGLLRLADMLGIDRAATLAVGDSENDLDMIHTAGLGLAMRNACDRLKEIADAVANCSNDEHIAKYLLETYY